MVGDTVEFPDRPSDARRIRSAENLMPRAVLLLQFRRTRQATDTKSRVPTLKEDMHIPRTARVPAIANRCVFGLGMSDIQGRMMSKWAETAAAETQAER